MKAFLMHKDADFDMQKELPWNSEALIQDMELNTLFNAMALGDRFVFDVAKRAVLSSLMDSESIVYRQNILKDCLKNPSIVRQIYDITIESIERRKGQYWSIFGRYPGTILHGSIEMMHVFVDLLRRLMSIAHEHADKFNSAGFASFFTMIKRELSEEYFGTVQDHLRELRFRNGVLVSAQLGAGNKGTDYVLRKPQDKREGWMKRIFAAKPPVYSFYIADRDENGARALSELRDRGINQVANALAQSSEHILSFFNMLRTELAFYIGCLNLHEQLARKGEPMSFPQPVASSQRRHSFSELYDVCLALTMEQKVVGNDVSADHRDLVIITGANQGGKSTFLRSIGLSQLMMQCGMFVPAESFRANICEGLFTHYKREEDVTMSSGKLDEELSRMSHIVDNLRANSMVLFNESFAATNEREGSEIARQIITALVEKRIKVFFVTHLYDFAHGIYRKDMENAVFLRAERQADGGRTFRTIEGQPLQTSYGEDLYNNVFGMEH